MLVKDWMSKDVISADVNDSMQEAMRLLKENKISMLPVMKRGKLVGIVTDRDLKQASASDATTLEVHELLFLVSKIKVQEIMTKDPVTIPFDFTVEEAAEVLLEHRISGAPVVDRDGKVIGTITKGRPVPGAHCVDGSGQTGHTVRLRAGRPSRIHSGSGRHHPSLRRPHGQHPEHLRRCSGGIPEGLHPHVRRRKGSAYPELEKELGEKAKYLYLVDHRENRREIFQ
jgi:acetoin utilization protein AcuB